MRYTLFLIVLITGSKASGQDFRQAMQDLQRTYANAADMQIVMSMAVYENERAKQPYHTTKVDIRKSGDNYHYRFGDNEMLLNARYFITVDRAAKEMIVQERDPGSPRQLQQTTQFNLDSIVAKHQEARWVDTQGTIEHFRVEDKKSPIRFVDMYIDTQTRFMKRMTYRYTSKQFVTLTFDVFDSAPEFTSDTFDSGRYITVAAGGLTPAAGFRAYHLMASLVKKQ